MTPHSQAGAPSPVRIERQGAVLTLILDREDRRNALNEAVVQALSEGFDVAASDPALRAVVLTGAGERAFCAGADLNKNVQGGAFEVDPSRPTHYLVALLRKMQACQLPVIARVNGHVMAGGIGLLCACDMAIAADDVQLGTPESKIGLTPMMILPGMMRLMPERKLLEMCITGEPLSAHDALAAGLLNYVVPRAQLDAKLQWLLARTVDKSPTAMRLGKQAFHAMRDMGMAAAYEYAQAMLPNMASTRDAKEGMQAFQDKRKPVWTGS